MLILAIETATPQVSVAIGGHEGVLGLFEVQRDKRHVETLAPAIEFLCRQAGIELAEISAIAVDVGAQKLQALIGGVPRLHDNEIQFVAEEIVNDVLVLSFDFEEVSEHADRSAGAVERASNCSTSALSAEAKSCCSNGGRRSLQIARSVRTVSPERAARPAKSCCGNCGSRTIPRISK